MLSFSQWGGTERSQCFCYPIWALLLFNKMGHTPSMAGNLRKKFRKNSGETPETLSERFLEFPSRVRLGCPKTYNSRHLRLPERFQNSLPPSTAGDASFSRIGSGEGLSELVMEFPAVLGVFLTKRRSEIKLVLTHIQRSPEHGRKTSCRDPVAILLALPLQSLTWYSILT